jgi:hypothetical protein
VTDRRSLRASFLLAPALLGLALGCATLGAGEWLGSFYADAAFPQREAEFLLVGMPVGFLRDFEAFAAARPELARWAVTAEDDNGIVESLSARRVD